MKIGNTIIAITAITAIAGLAFAGCDSQPKGTSGKQEAISPNLSDVKKETVEALKTTGEFLEIKAEEGGKAIVEAGEKAGEAVEAGIDNFQDESKDKKEALEHDPEPGDE